MSRSKHCKKHAKGGSGKGAGFEFWGRRASATGMSSPGRYSNTVTHRIERRQAKNETKEQSGD